MHWPSRSRGHGSKGTNNRVGAIKGVLGGGERKGEGKKETKSRPGKFT